MHDQPETVPTNPKLPGIGIGVDDELPTTESAAPDEAVNANPDWDSITHWKDAIRTWWPELAQVVEGALSVGDFSMAVAQASTLVEESVRRMADAPPDVGGVKLFRYAFGPPEGVLSKHLPGGEAEGYQKLFDGLSQGFRNKSHHSSDAGIPPQEAVQAIGALNLALSVARRLAQETYLQPFLPRTGFAYFLQARHFDLAGDGNLTRFVTFAWGRSTPQGQVIAMRNGPVGWRRLVGQVFMPGAFLDGELVTAACLPNDELQVVASFAQPAGSGLRAWAAVPMRVMGDSLQIIPAPAEATWSFNWRHEIKDVLGKGSCQLISHRLLADGSASRLYFELNGGEFELIHVDADSLQSVTSANTPKIP